MALSKLFQRIFWHNNTTPAINEDNLNAMSKAIDDIDDRVIALGDDVMTVVPQIQAYLNQAEDLVEAMELLSENPPYIGSNGNWYVWDTNTSAFIDSGVDASITVNIADISMLDPSATPYVTNSGTATDPVFHLFIPRGQTGQNGVSPAVTITPITGGHKVTITDASHPSGQSFDVMDGEVSRQELGSLGTAFANNVNENGCKNLLPMNAPLPLTSRGVTYSLNTDKSIHVNGNNTSANVALFFPMLADQNESPLFNVDDYFDRNETYVGHISDSNVNVRLVLKFKDANETDLQTLTIYTHETFTIPSGAVTFFVDIRVGAGTSISNKDVYPMLCLKSDYDLDPTYVPHSKTNRQLTEDSVTWEDYSEVGAVNYCKNNATTTTTTDGTTTFTWTVNDDKSVTVSAPSYPVTLASHQTLTIWNSITADGCILLVGKTFRLSGCPSGGGSNNYKITVYRAESADGSTGTPEDYGDGKIFTWKNNGSGTKANVSLSVRSGYTMTGPLTFKPMLTDPSYNGPYVPYAMTNRELTEQIITTGTTPLSNSGTDYELIEGFIYKKRGVNILRVAVKCVTPSPIAGGNHIKFSELPSGFPHPPAIIYTSIPCYRDGTTNVSAELQISTDGNLRIRGGEAGARYSGLFAF